LLPQREFAYRRGIAPSTAGRVYEELLRRGLAIGEIGRGTFVVGPLSQTKPPLSEPSDTQIDLKHLFPNLVDQEVAIARSLESLLRDPMRGMLKPITALGTTSARILASRFFCRPGWSPSPDQFLFTAHGKQAIAAAIAAIVPPGARVGVEALTFATMKTIAQQLGVTLVPISMDDKGIRTDLLKAVHRRTQLSALYLQPVLHNPLGITLNAERRAAVAQFATETDLTVIEDAVNSFLSDAPPLASILPDRCIVIESLSKRIAPGLTMGAVIAPLKLVESVASSIRTNAWQAPAFAFNAVLQLMRDGTAASIVAAKRRDASERQTMAERVLSNFVTKSDPGAYHLWVELPRWWRSHQLVAAAGRHGVALSPSSLFAVRRAHAPNAVRIALCWPSSSELRCALETLARLLRSRPSKHPA
jgi:DNA-binding transcriptional MocR family regulator